MHTNRFHLLPISPSDLEFIFEGLSDPVNVPYYGIYYKTLEETKQQLEWYKEVESKGGEVWKIVFKDSNERAGVISYYKFEAQHKRAEIGYWLLPKFWSQGILSEVLCAVLDHIGSERKIHRLEAFVESENTASIRLLEKCGFQYEGTMRECEIKFGRYISLMIFSKIFNLPVSP